MLWNVYVIDEGECVKFNQEPYTHQMVGWALKRLTEGGNADFQVVTLVPSGKSVSFEQIYSSIRAASGNAWDDVKNVEAELAAIRGGNSAETEVQP